MIENKIAIIGCSKSKQNYTCRADEMYTGTIFQKSYEVAKQITDNIYILSAKYGLLKPDTIIEPYDLALLSNVFDYSIANPIVRKSYGKHRRLRNKIIGNRLEQKLIEQSITNKGYETYTFVSEYYIRVLEKSVLVEPYKNLTLGSGGMFGLRGDYLKNQLNKLNELPLGFRKEHLK
jgi:hypothetical protein